VREQVAPQALDGRSGQTLRSTGQPPEGMNLAAATTSAAPRCTARTARSTTRRRAFRG